MKKTKKKAPLVSIIMGSESDFKIMEDATKALDEFKVSWEVGIVSAHRTPEDMMEFAKTAMNRGIRVIIAGAGGAAHLPGMVASFTELPVIGVPVPLKHLEGLDSLLSIVQMPKGVPVASVAVGNAYNAGILAVKIIAGGSQDRDLLQKLTLYRVALRKIVHDMRIKIKKKGF